MQDLTLASRDPRVSVSVDSEEVADGVVLDFAENGVPVGVDVQHASERADIHRLVVSQLPVHDLQGRLKPSPESF